MNRWFRRFVKQVTDTYLKVTGIILKSVTFELLFGIQLHLLSNEPKVRIWRITPNSNPVVIVFPVNV